MSSVGEVIVEALDEYLTSKDNLERFGSFDPGAKPYLTQEMESKRLHFVRLLDSALGAK